MIDMLSKKRGVIVKGKKRLLENIFLAILIILGIYLFNLEIDNSGYKVRNESNSTANYIEVQEVLNKEIVEEEPIVFDGLTFKELSEKINNVLNSTITGKGELIVSHSLEKGVDPYMATAIMLHETGCKWGCSYLVNACNNVGGQKGSGCGDYAYFNSLDEGIIAFINNLSNNYISYGLTTPEQINPKYAEDPLWAQKVNKYINIIKTQ